MYPPSSTVLIVAIAGPQPDTATDPRVSVPSSSSAKPRIPPISTTTATTPSRRIVSNASIAAPDEDSSGGSRVWASKEKASDLFANNLMLHVISSIWPDGVKVDWVQGRPGDTTLVWSSAYIPIPSRSIPSLVRVTGLILVIPLLF